MKNIILVDDHEIVLEGIEILSQKANFQIIEKFTRARQALQYLKKSKSHIFAIISDIDIPGMNGIEFLKEVKKQYPEIKRVIFSLHSELIFINQAKKIGVDGYILKSEGLLTILKALYNISLGETYYSQEIKHLLYSNILSDEEGQIRQQILKQLSLGKSAKEIGKELGKSQRTIEYHAAHLRKKFGVKNNIELIQQFINQNPG
ncbi:MAG: response regulator transcription factor [Leptospiraceae bacterium]|nr:response regulator transcription factor [Leptospiraceae bacterium]MCP5499674.1 response regulator transcription factor [Leptospiraceae bacterium]